MAKIVMAKTKEAKIKNFYPNVFKDEVKEIIGNIDNGTVVDIVTSEMEFLARAYVTLGTSAIARVLTTKDEKIDKDFFYSRIKSAYEKENIYLLKQTVSEFLFRSRFNTGLNN